MFSLLCFLHAQLISSLSFDDPDDIWQQKIQQLFNINISQFGVFFSVWATNIISFLFSEPPVSE